MNKKRTSLKGKGASIFLEEEEQQHASKPVHHNTITPAKQIKVTYFIDGGVNDQLEELWLTLRKKFKNKKISKSKIVEIAVRNLVNDWDSNQGDSQIESVLKDGIK